MRLTVNPAQMVHEVIAEAFGCDSKRVQVKGVLFGDIDVLGSSVHQPLANMSTTVILDHLVNTLSKSQVDQYYSALFLEVQLARCDQ